MKKSPLFILLVASTGVLVSTSCRDKDQTALEYMPNMYRSPSSETYDPSPTYEDGSFIFENGLSAQTPPDGSIPRGYKPYDYPNSQAGYDSALATLKSPYHFQEVDREKLMAEGKELYNIFCSHCHGTKGDGNGILMEREKFLGVPAYSRDRLPNITEGSIYHVITHGKNLMGSHASQLTEDERWKIVHYVLQLREQLSPAPVAESANQTEA